MRIRELHTTKNFFIIMRFDRRKTFIHSSLVFVLATMLFSCSFFADPACVGDAPECNDQSWRAPYKIKREEYYCEETLPDQTPISLAELIDYGLRNNPQTKNTWNSARARAYVLYANYNTFYPRIDATAEVELIKSNFSSGTAGGAAVRGATAGNIINATSAINTSDSLSNGTTGGGIIALGGSGGVAGAGPVYNQFFIADLSLSYIMFDFGGRQANVEAARQALYTANWTHNRTLQTVILNIMQAYYNYLAAQATVEAQKENLHDAKNNLDSAKAMYDAGVARLVDFLLARSNYVNAQLLLEQAYNNAHITMGQLSTAIGIPADRQIKVVPMPEHLPETQISNDMSALLEKAKQFRPDLAAAYSSYLNALEQITIQYSSGMPLLSAFADYQKVNFIHDPVNSGYISSGGIVATGPLFDGFLARNLTKSAQAQAAAAYATYKNSEEQAFLDVVTSYYSFKTAVETVQYSKEYLEYAQEAYDVAYYGYREGVSSLLDLLTATVSLANARTSYIQARTQYLTSIASLAYATGTLE